MKLHDLFQDGVIFQANKPIRIFGTGGGMLTIQFCGYKIETEMVGARWTVELPPMPYGGPYEMTISLDGRESTLKDIYIGDVYVLAGQSNMQFQLWESDCRDELYRTDSLLRLFSTERPEKGERFFPQDGWVEAKVDTVQYWSSIGYMMGTALREKMCRAVGLITCYQGAADIQSYLPESAFDNPAFLIPEEERFDKDFLWNKGHSMLFRYQTKEIAPFSVDSIIWYQGESNCSKRESAVYGDMLSTLISSWRQEFRDAGLPFVVVQIADNDERCGDTWSAIQRAQEEISHKEQYVKTVICRDICESTDIHPKKKYRLALRIADAVLEGKT